MKEGREFVNSDGVFSASCWVSISSNPIAPPIEELNRHVKNDVKNRPNSRSPSPTRVVSRSPNDRSASAKRKRKMIGNIVKGSLKEVDLTVLEGQ